MMSLECKRGKSMNDLGKSIDNMVKETNPTGQIAKKPTDYKGVETTPYGHVYNFNGGSITDLGEERRKMNPKGFDANKKYGFSYTKGGDEVYADDFKTAYQALARPSAKKNMIHTDASANARLKELQTYMDSLEDDDPIDLELANEYENLKNLVGFSKAANPKKAETPESVYKAQNDIIRKNMETGKDLMDGVDQAKYAAAKQKLSEAAKKANAAKPNIDKEYMKLMDGGMRQEDAEANLRRRGFTDNQIRTAYGNIRYGDKYKDWKGNDNYRDPNKKAPVYNGDWGMWADRLDEYVPQDWETDGFDGNTRIYTLPDYRGSIWVHTNGTVTAYYYNSNGKMDIVGYDSIDEAIAAQRPRVEKVDIDEDYERSYGPDDTQEVREWINNYDFNGTETLDDVINLIREYEPSITAPEAKSMAQEVIKSGKVGNSHENAYMEARNKGKTPEEADKEANRKYKIAQLKAKYKNNPEALRLIEDILPYFEGFDK